MNLAQRLTEVVEKSGIPGAAVAYSVGSEVTEAAAGVLNLDTGVEVTVDSVFQIGSVTKLWTATLVQQLVDEGLVDLDAPVRSYLPDFTLADDAVAAAVTVRDLLRHTTGFAGDLVRDYGRGDDAVARYVAGLADVEAIARPGELYSYCNAGYSVLGHLVATLRGLTWEQAVREYLVRPLELDSITLFAEEAILRRASVGHIIDPDTGDQRRHPEWQLPRSGGPAGTSLSATPRSLLGFARLFMDGGRPGVLSAEAVARGWEPQATVPGGGDSRAGLWGLGWAIYDWGGHRAVGHGGATLGQYCAFLIMPEKDFAIAGMANGQPQGTLLYDLVYPLVEEITGVAVPPPPVPPAVPGQVDLTPYLGDYTDPRGSFRIDADGEALRITYFPGEVSRSLGMTEQAFRFVHLRDDTFIGVELEGRVHPTVTFVRNGDGLVTHAHDGRATPRVG